MLPMFRGTLPILVLAILASLSAAQTPKQLPHYETKYYVIYTDLAGDDLREAELRMTRMVEEYHNRTKDFSGSLGHKFPFYLFKNEEDYYAAGGTRGSAGMFNPNDDTLMAMVGSEGHVSDRTWNVVQHEGFHQFARAVIGGQLPTWANEGLAEYFGEGIFTGDSFVTGVIPPERLARVKKDLKSNAFRSIKDIMLLAHADWNADLSMGNYDQAWSMVQFLAHAENGKYQPAFGKFMRTIATGQQWEQAWLASFGSAEGFEKRWENYWVNLEPTATANLFLRANVLTMTSALARAAASRQKFTDFDALAAAAKEGSLQINPNDWLPPKLITSAFADATALRKRQISYELVPQAGNKLPTIVCTMRDGTKLIGSFRLGNGRVVAVNCSEQKTR